ncbi:unnamed protein product [Toxocara canis]|uniref:CTNNB1_binding domain-containing protein n=1 Tax=Toxocara canis TaxID=6265 RepID=A0A183U955_TOXCA|nr:unnamed protein product [Toxocara canis]
MDYRRNQEDVTDEEKLEDSSPGQLGDRVISAA